MKSKLTMMVAMAAACAAIQLVAMPTEEETRKSEPVVKKMLAQERAALESGKKTRSEVAVAAMKLADEADTDAAKLLLMKGAFELYVRDGNLEKAVETMNALKATIPDIPPQSVTNIIETALLGVSKKEDGAPLYKLLDESKADIASIGASSMVVKERNSIASILKGMIKVPGGDLWLSETELTQGQWEAVMGNNPSLHKGVNLPVENISRDECDIFLEKLNQTKEVQASLFEFCLPGRAEWAGAARAGNPDLIPWIKPEVAGELLDMAWLKENSDGETHAVATKVPNAFGFYDMVGNVHEWVIEAPETRGTKRGYSFANPLSYCRPGRFSHHERNKRFADTGLRLAAHVRPQPALMTSGATGKTEVTAPKGGLARLRQRRMEAERQAAESAQRQTAAEREALRQIQEELRRKREARQAEKSAGVSGIQTKKFPLAQGLELEMIKCPAGEFMMGYESWKTWASSQNRQLRKLHRVKLTKDFMLGKFPVTCSQWYAIMGNGKKAPKGLEDTPAGNITVPEMQAFCDKLTAKFKAQLGGKVFRLPTDAEWEYASKGGKNLDGMLGKTLGLNGNTGSSSRDGKEVEAIFRQMGYTAEDHARASDTNKPFFMWNPLAVGKYKPNEWGFMDLTGNAWEVTADTIMDTVLSKEGGISSFIHVWNGRQRYSDFEIDPLLKGERHLVRTGFWEKGIAHGIGNKMGIGDNDRFPAVGFRVCIGEPLGDWNNAFSLNAAPGSVTELDLGNVPPLQFVYCPAGKFSMGYKEQPALSKVKEIEITSPFWVSKTPIRVDQLASLGINSITDARIGAAGIDDASIVVQKLPSVLKERFGKMLPPGYVFRLPTEAEFEYLQKAETKDKNAQTNIWGVERLYAGGYIGLLDRAPEYGKGVDVVNRWHDAMAWTDLVKVNYENQPDKDPVGWSDNPNWSVFRRGLARDCGGGKLITTQCNSNLYGFYFVVAPDVDKLNKFYWK